MSTGFVEPGAGESTEADRNPIRGAGMSSTQIVEDALTILESKGWHQGGFGNERVGYCIAGALYRAASAISPWEESGRDIFSGALRPIQEQIGIGNVAHWNDEEGRTFSQVREIFRRAAYMASGRTAGLAA